MRRSCPANRPAPAHAGRYQRVSVVFEVAGDQAMAEVIVAMVFNFLTDELREGGARIRRTGVVVEY